MKCGSLFSGVGGFDLGLERAGFDIAWQCEADEKARTVLRRHWPDIPCYEDVRNIRRSDADGRRGEQPDPAERWGRRGAVSDVDVLCGGFPCQDLSVAGKRAGLAGERSGLFYEFMRIADELVRPGGFVLVENVPGLLSSNGGRDFAIVLASLAELGFHDLAYRVLDSRFFGVPQRRRRVFILARRSRGRCCAEVLLEPEGGAGNPPASGEAGARVAASLSRGSSRPGVSAPGRRQEDDENIVVSHDIAPAIDRGVGDGARRNQGGVSIVVNALDTRQGGADDNDAQAGHLVAGPITKRTGKGPNTTLDDGALVTHSLTAEGFDASEDGTGRGTPLVPIGESEGRGSGDADRPTADDGRREAGARLPSDSERERGSQIDPDGVREIAELSRRMDCGVTCSFDPKPDGPRYAQMGNAVTVNVSEWIGRRLMAAVQSETQAMREAA